MIHRRHYTNAVQLGPAENTGQGLGLATQQSTDASRPPRMCRELQQGHQKSSEAGGTDRGGRGKERVEAGRATGRKRRMFSQTIKHFTISNSALIIQILRML